MIFSVALDSQAQRDIGPLTPAGAVPSEVGTTVSAGDSDFQLGRHRRPPRRPATAAAQASPTQAAMFR